MSNDWSLKGKCIRPFPSVGKSGFYSKDDIEILREKFIEDMKEYMDSLGYIRYYDEIEMIKVINKLFGVETD